MNLNPKIRHRCSWTSQERYKIYQNPILIIILYTLTDTPLTKKVRYTAGVALGRHFAPRNFSAFQIFLKLLHIEVLLNIYFSKLSLIFEELSFCFVFFYYVLLSIEGKRELEWRRNSTYVCIA